MSEEADEELLKRQGVVRLKSDRGYASPVEQPVHTEDRIPRVSGL